MERITDGMVVSLAYRLTVEGDVVAQTDDGEPLEYLHGAQNIVPGLEAALDGKVVGDKISVTLTPDEAYGAYDEEDYEEVDRADIPDADQLEVGMVLEVEDEDGYSYMAFVKELTADTVVLDFNPPLAGKTLTYDVEVMGMRTATEEELAHGHVHGDGQDEFEDDGEYEEEDEE